MSPIPETTAGKLFLVSGLHGGREVFLGKALDEPREGRLSLRGKVLSMTPEGRMVVRPFSTTMSIALGEPDTPVQHVSDERAADEAGSLLELSATHVTRSGYPSIVRWVEGAVCLEETQPAPILASNGGPTTALQLEFLSTAEELRRVLLRARRVESTRELDQVVELEGNLRIEVGKITNRAAIRLHEILGRERELAEHVEVFQEDGGGADPSMRGATGGWPLLFELLQTAKAWARRQGKTEVVREINGLVKDAVHGLNEVVLEHQNALDTLVTEAFGQYGLVETLVPAGARAEAPAATPGLPLGVRG